MQYLVSFLFLQSSRCEGGGGGAAAGFFSLMSYCCHMAVIYVLFLFLNSTKVHTGKLVQNSRTFPRLLTDIFLRFSRTENLTNNTDLHVKILRRKY